MRHTLLICGIACLILSGVARRAEAQPDTLWTRAYDFGVNSTLQASIELRNGGFAAAGYTAQGQELNALIMAIDPLGDTLWTRIIGDVGVNEKAYSIAELSSGTLVVCGYDYTPQLLYVNRFFSDWTAALVKALASWFAVFCKRNPAIG